MRLIFYLMTPDRPKPKEPRKLFLKHILRKLFLEDWAMKLTALVITLGLWFGVTGLSTPTTKRFTVPLNLNIASNAQIVNVPRQEVDIEISGDKRKIEQISRTELIAELDLTDMQPGDSVVSLSPENVVVKPLPQGVKTVEIIPRSIAVNLEAVEEKEIEVKVETTGNPAVGYEVYDNPSVPPTIRVRGPASVVRMLEFIQTDPIDITGRKGNFIVKQVGVTASNPKVALVRDTVVDVLFEIGEKRVERTFTVPVAGLPGKSATFTVFCARTLLQKARADEFKAEMGANENGGEVLMVTLPPQLEEMALIRKPAVKKP